MTKMSISVSKGAGSLGHNNREFQTINVDTTRTHLNVVYKQEPLQEAYRKLFSEAVEQYNEKQKRADRKINNYMEKIRMSKNGEKLFYETIVQVGNRYTCGTLSGNGKVAKQILDEYMQDFQKRNPNLYVFNAVLHLDEPKGTPHIHIDWIPVACGYQRGMQVRNSLDKALCQQGCEPVEDNTTKKKDFLNATQKWEWKEKEAVECIMSRYGWERAEESGLHRKKLAISQYKAIASEIENQISILPEEIVVKKVPMSNDKVVVSKTDLQELESKAKLLRVYEDSLQGLEQKLIEKSEEQEEYFNDKMKKLRVEQDRVEHNRRAVESIYQQALREQSKGNVIKEKYERLYEEQLELNKSKKELEKICLELKVVIDNLKEENGSLKAQIQKLKDAITNQGKVLCEGIRDICKSITMFKYDKETGYKASLTKKQAVLIDAIANYGSKVIRKEGYVKMAENVEKYTGISDSINSEIKRIGQKKEELERR